MWPQLLALIPHLSRLVPTLEKYFSNRQHGDAAMAAMADGIRSDVGQITKAHNSLYRQLQDQSAQIADVAGEITRLRMAVESAQHRADALELQTAALAKWLRIGIITIAALLVVLSLLVAQLISRVH